MSELNLAQYYAEVIKTAELKPETTEDVSEEKIAAVQAVSEQFDIDGISFDSNEEKIAAAIEIVEGFEKVAMTGTGGEYIRDALMSKNKEERRKAHERFGKKSEHSVGKVTAVRGGLGALLGGAAGGAAAGGKGAAIGALLGGGIGAGTGAAEAALRNAAIRHARKKAAE